MLLQGAELLQRGVAGCVHGGKMVVQEGLDRIAGLVEDRPRTLPSGGAASACSDHCCARKSASGRTVD